MMIQVRLDEAESDLELRSLCEWLADDPAVGRSADVSLRARENGPGRMGLGFDAVQLIVDSAFQLSSLAIAIDGWRRAYAARPKMTVERNGVRVSFATADTDGARSILRALEELERVEQVERWEAEGETRTGEPRAGEARTGETRAGEARDGGTGGS
ncbi:effector-associated constant component EACC1 [Streptomyces chrestomyceticus]|uniref:effector-associated constant component EACC1 n=1 Tax=Streptomyces chrestomyceticus TaxID=68185 RepID=UPI00378C0A54